MNSLAPKTYEIALERARSRPSKPRKPLARGKGLKSAQNAVGLKRGPKNTITAKGRDAKKAKRKKMPSRKSLIVKLDSLTSQIVRLRDGGRCVLFGINQNCLGSERLQCGHIFGRRSHGARFDIEVGGNTAAQCANCNQLHNYRPWVFYRWFIGLYGQETFDAMYTRWSRGQKYSRSDLIALIAEYQTKLDSMKG